MGASHQLDDGICNRSFENSTTTVERRAGRQFVLRPQSSAAGGTHICFNVFKHIKIDKFDLKAKKISKVVDYFLLWINIHVCCNSLVPC